MADSERGHVGEADGGIRYVRFGGLDFTMDFAVQAIYVTIVFLLISAIWTYWTQDCFGYKDGNADRNIAVIILGQLLISLFFGWMTFRIARHYNLHVRGSVKLTGFLGFLGMIFYLIFLNRNTLDCIESSLIKKYYHDNTTGLDDFVQKFTSAAEIAEIVILSLLILGCLAMLVKELVC